MEVQYQLSPDYTFVEGKALKHAMYDAGLLDMLSGDILLLNAELATLLTVFKEPAAVSDATQVFAHQLNGSFTDLQSIIQSSIETYVDQGILVTTERYQQKLAFPFPSLQPHDRLKGYAVIKELAKTPPVGVYLVRNQLGKKCILKKMFVHPKASQKLIRSQSKEFAYEFLVLSHLKGCPSVGKVVEFDSKEKIGVTDYFPGISLHKFMIGNHDLLPLATRISLFRQLVNSVASLHNKRVIHGDLHYSNVLVNKKARIRLIDFDLAFFMDDRKKNRKSGGILEFLPPERLTSDIFHQSAGTPDFQAEVYQLGILGYFIFHAKLPFINPTWREQVNAIRSTTPPWEAAIPEKLRELIETAMHKEPSQRFASAAEMKAQLAESL